MDQPQQWPLWIGPAQQSDSVREKTALRFLQVFA
jgi:hypothetical protein